MGSKPRCFHFEMLIVEIVIPSFHLTYHFYHLITEERNCRVPVHNEEFPTAVTSHLIFQTTEVVQLCSESKTNTLKEHSGGF